MGLSLTACDQNSVKQGWAYILSFANLDKSPPAANQGKDSDGSGPVKGMTDDEYSSAAAKNAKANAEIFHEIFQCIFMREPKDRSEFGNWVDTLNQGASLEGVYNGLTHSSEYRKLEALHTGASAEAVRVFAEELAWLESELPIPTQFDSTSASPLPVIGNPDAVDGQEISFPQKLANPNLASPGPSPKVDLKVLAEGYLRQFIGASIFTLKRVLGEEALRVVAAKSQYKEKLAIWYSRWVVRIAQQRKVDFGIPLRNKPDEAFHFKWVVEGNEDRVKWEVLNRLHRILNEANRQKQ
jgi:hypothetical protein